MTRVETDLAVPVSNKDHVYGPATASVILVEYGDYECPYCGEAFPIIQQLLERSKDVRFVFRNFPLTTSHPHAEHAAEAAEAASAQGQFWQMHDLLYANQEGLDDESLLGYAERISLNRSSFVEALNDGRYRSLIRHDFMGGVKSGVNGTPYFFINGYRYTGNVDLSSLLDALSEAESPVR